MATLWLSVIVLLPLASVVVKSTQVDFWHAATNHVARSALWLSLWTSGLVALLNAVFGTLTAWVLVRDRFRGKAVVNVLIDLPFALPTVVAGITLLALYGQSSPFGIDIAYTRWAIVMALAFVTLPFVVRAVQPVIMELDVEVEHAAYSLGASRSQTFRRVILPGLIPAILSGAALSFARAIGEFGSIVLVGGTQPFHHPDLVGLHLLARGVHPGPAQGGQRRRGGRGPAGHLPARAGPHPALRAALRAVGR